MIYITFSYQVNSGIRRNIKTAKFKSKCNSYHHKLQYLRGSDKNVLRAPLLQVIS